MFGPSDRQLYEEAEIYMKVVALDIGVDTGEFWQVDEEDAEKE